MAPDFLSPDVIATEVQGQSSQIPSVSTSAYALAGYSLRGPEGQAIISTSFQQFVSTFGTFTPKSFNTYSVAAYFQNGGTELIFVRALHGDATFANATFPATWYVQASGRGVWANGATVVISGSPNFFSTVSGGYTAFDVTIALIDPTTGLLTVSETYQGLDLLDPTDPSYILNTINSESQDVTFQAVSGGGIPAGLLPVDQDNVLFATGVSGLNAYTGSVSGTGLPVLPGSMSFSVSGSEVGVDDSNGNIILSSPSSASSVSGSVNYTTGQINIFISPAPNMGDAITTDYIQTAGTAVMVTLSGGNDGSNVVASDVVGLNLLPLKQGIYALDDIPDQFTLALPDFPGDPTTQKALLGYADGRQDIVVLVEPPKGSTPQQAANYKRNILQSVDSFGAMYYPWVKIPDPLNSNRALLIPPSGHVAGRYAFTDSTTNVGKAPAGVTRGQLTGFIIGMERSLSKAERDIVNQAQINAIRSDSEVGTAIWGNNTLQIVGDFTDVNIRRLFIFLRKTQELGLLDIVFEDVGPTTFGIIKTRLDTFLEGLFLTNVIGSGVTSKDQAFKVVVDSSNNPPAIQQKKLIIIDEYIKPNLAAEVIWLRLQRVFDASQL